MRAYEFLKENNTLSNAVATALPATYILPELQNQDPYLQYRFGVAIASAKGAKRRQEDGIQQFKKETTWGENQIISSVDPNIEEYIDDALKQLNLSKKQLISTKKSEEPADTNNKSPVNTFKGYK